MRPVGVRGLARWQASPPEGLPCGTVQALLCCPLNSVHRGAIPAGELHRKIVSAPSFPAPSCVRGTVSRGHCAGKMPVRPVSVLGPEFEGVEPADREPGNTAPEKRLCARFLRGVSGLLAAPMFGEDSRQPRPKSLYRPSSVFGGAGGLCAGAFCTGNLSLRQVPVVRPGGGRVFGGCGFESPDDGGDDRRDLEPNIDPSEMSGTGLQLGGG